MKNLKKKHVKKMALKQDNQSIKDFKITNRILSSLRKTQAPLIAILGGMLIGAIILLLSGHNPITAYVELFIGAFGGADNANLASTISRAAPIVGMAMCAVIAFRAGFTNIGGEGQLIIGGITAALVGVYFPLPNPILLPVTILLAALAAGLYALIAAFMQFKFRVPLLISTLLMNYPAKIFATYLVTNPFKDVPSFTNQTYMVTEGIRFPLIVPHTQLHAGIFITVAIVIMVIFIDRQTVIGYKIRMTGLNKRFANYGGIDVTKLGYRVMFTSGAIAGIVGAIEVLGITYRYVDGALALPMYAWNGLMAALLVESNPFGALLAGFFFSALQTGGFGMERNTAVARELSRVLQALIIMLVAVSPSLSLIQQKMKWKKKNES